MRVTLQYSGYSCDGHSYSVQLSYTTTDCHCHPQYTVVHSFCNLQFVLFFDIFIVNNTIKIPRPVLSSSTKTSVTSLSQLTSPSLAIECPSLACFLCSDQFPFPDLPSFYLTCASYYKHLYQLKSTLNHTCGVLSCFLFSLPLLAHPFHPLIQWPDPLGDILWLTHNCALPPMNATRLFLFPDRS